MDQTIVVGRWESSSIARIYINQSVAQAAEIKFTTEHDQCLRTAASFLKALWHVCRVFLEMHRLRQEWVTWKASCRDPCVLDHSMISFKWRIYWHLQLIQKTFLHVICTLQRYAESLGVATCRICTMLVLQHFSHHTTSLTPKALYCKFCLALAPLSAWHVGYGRLAAGIPVC